MSVTIAPLLGEPLPIELANATYAVRGRLRDGLGAVEQLVLWLEHVRARLPVTLTDADLAAVADSDLVAAREIRDSIRALATAAVNGTHPGSTAVETLNRHARWAPQWRELRWGQPPSAQPRSAAPPVVAALSAIAQAAVDLFAGPVLTDLRACHAPGCVLFFVKDHPRREWCSTGCGNRARAARHYNRTHNNRPTTSNATARGD